MRTIWRRARGAAAVALALAVVLPGLPAAAQTLGDIRAEVEVLNGQIQELREQLVQSGARPAAPGATVPALQRLDQLEAELRRLTNRVDVLTNDVNRIVEDATNRVGDIEFRLTELEGGDVSTLGKPEPLGGGVSTPTTPPPAAAGTGATELAIGEQSGFDAGVKAVQAGDHAKGAELLAAFLATYPGGPLASEAQFWRGEALAGQGAWSEAARSYLDAFSGAPQGPKAPQALYRLAVSLGRLGKTQEACLTLTEVDSRYPGSEVARQVAQERAALRCR